MPILETLSYSYENMYIYKERVCVCIYFWKLSPGAC